MAGGLHPWEGNRAAQTVVQREEVPGALLLGDGKGLLHLDLATVCDRHILQGLVPTVGLGALHLPYYLLGRKAEEHSESGGPPLKGERPQNMAGEG